MKKIVFLFIFLSAIIFASGEVILKISAKSLDPFQITFIRFFVGGIFLFPFLYFERRSFKKNNLEEDHKFQKKDLLILLTYGIVLVLIDMVFFQLAINLSEASLVAVVFSSNPIFTIILSHFIISDDKLTLKKILAIVLEIAGIILMILPFLSKDKFLGVVFAVLSAIFFGVYSSIGKKTIKRIGTFTQTSISFFLGSLALLIVLIIFRMPIIKNVESNIFVILYASIILTALGYAFYFLAIRFSKPSVASATFFLKIIIAPIFALIILGEQLTTLKIFGIILILIGSIVLSLPEKEKGVL